MAKKACPEEAVLLLKGKAKLEESGRERGRERASQQKIYSHEM